MLMENYDSELCARVRYAREELTDLTQDQMADAIGCGRSAYRHYEGGRMSRMPHRYMPKFCDVTGVREDWLITGEGEPQQDKVDIALQSVISKMKTARKKRLLKMAKILAEEDQDTEEQDFNR